MAETPQPPSSLAQSLRVLRPGPFRRYMVGESISSIGTWMQMMAQTWVMTSLTSSATVLGLVNFASTFPTLLLTFTGGSAADKHDKRNILLICQLAQICLALALGYVVMIGQIKLWHVMICALLLGISTAFEMPSASALVPELVPHDEIQNAIAVDRMSFHTTRLLGPALAGLLIGGLGKLYGEGIGTAAAFYANALSFVALMVALATLPAQGPRTEEEVEKRSGGMKDGFAYVRQDKPTLAMIMLMALTTVFVFPVMTIMMPLYGKQVLGFGADRIGLLMSVSALGSLVGAIGLLGVPRERRLGRMAIAVGAITLSLVGLSFAHDFWTCALSMVLLTVGLSTNIGLANTTVQERAPDHLRGRVSAIAGLSFFGIQPVAGLLITGVSDLLRLSTHSQAMGMRLAIGLAAGLFAIAASLVLAFPARAASRPTPEAAAPAE